MSVPVGEGPQVNEFEQVPSDDHQMSVVGGRLPGLILLGVGGRFQGLMSGGGRSPGLMSGGGGSLGLMSGGR